ncbi:MAG: hypothetical protein IKO36_05805 [Bacteroidaceae bacterium]|nr:hypothetical protein [Bacteroidaceae bacterium]
MDEFDIEKSMQTTFNLLNEVDILSIIMDKKNGGKEIEVHDLMDTIEAQVGEKVFEYPELEGFLFDAVSDCEFIEYLENRYPNKVYSREITKYYIDAHIFPYRE